MRNDKLYSMRSAARLLLFSQLSLLVFLLVCFLLMPHFLLESDEGGISNYGVYARTIVPYTLAFGVCGLLLVRAAQVLSPVIAHYRTLQRALLTIGFLQFLILESTYLYQVSDLFDAVHVYTGVALFLAETIFAIWLWRAYTRDVLQTAYFLLQATGFLLSLLTYFGVLHLLFIAEASTGAGFAALLVRTVRRAEVAVAGAELS